MSAVLNALDAPAASSARRPVPAESEFAFCGADFERVRRLIFERAGISLGAGKQAMVYSRLSRRLRDTEHRSFGSYLQWLEHASGAAAETEWQEFVNCLTTNLTAFFREEHHFDALAAELERRGGEHLRIWCNAASTGEEPYTIAMTVVEALGDPFDIVFCRNVMIYFNAATQRRVLEGIRAVMRPQGLLFVGHSENFSEAKDLFRLRGKTIYERT
jgi:chemotaxis methyl-accepting protein methylase